MACRTALPGDARVGDPLRPPRQLPLRVPSRRLEACAVRATVARPYKSTSWPGVTTTDGPFAETKEGLGGFYVVEAKDLDEALELGKACPGLRYGAAIEVRPVVEFEADYADREVEGSGASA